MAVRVEMAVTYVSKSLIKIFSFLTRERWKELLWSKHTEGISVTCSLSRHFSSKQTYLQKACNSLGDKIFSFLARAPKIGPLGAIVCGRLQGVEGTEQVPLKSYITSWTYSWSVQVREWSRTTEQRLLEWKYSTDGHSSAIWLALEDWINRMDQNSTERC